MKTENRILINIIGIGYDICVGEVSPELTYAFSKAVKQEKQSLYHLLFDEAFYKKYAIPQMDNPNSNYLSWKDFNNQAMYRGPNLLENGQLEIWIHRKRAKTYMFHELTNKAILFPLFDTREQILSEMLNNETSILIGVQEKGHLAKFKMKIDKFIPEELQLHIVQFQCSNVSIKLLHKITYSGVVLKSLKQDTVVTGTVFTMI